MPEKMQCNDALPDIIIEVVKYSDIYGNEVKYVIESKDFKFISNYKSYPLL
jgi:hypothetical protein